VSDEEVSAYYQENQNRFQNQEKVKVDYISLDVNDIAASVEATDAELEEYYQLNGNRYRQDEQRRFSHILIEIADDEATAQTQASNILAKVKSGEDFAELAKTHSADTFSGENGGDLEWVELGVMDEAFDEAAFSLVAAGDVSEVVKTDFGFHIIKLTEIKAEQVKAFAEVKEEILATVKKQKAEDKFFELQQEMARLSFEFPDSLEDAAGAVGTNVKTTDWLSRFGNAVPFDNNKVIEAAFSELVVNEQMNSDVIEVNDSLAMVIRVNEYQAANVKPLSEVTEQIKTALVAEKATQQAETVAAELLTAFKAGDDISEKLAGVGAVFEAKADVPRYGADIDNALAREAFKLPHPSEGKVSAATVTLSNGDLALVEVQSVKAGASEENANLAQQQTQQLAQVAYKVFVDTLREQAKISRRESVETSSQL
jgi:peptidyl-prolyl cis-trans isomerase D